MNKVKSRECTDVIWREIINTDKEFVISIPIIKLID